MSLKISPMRSLLLMVLVGVASAVAVLGLALAGRGFSARERPSWLETFLARNARKIATPTDARALKNPLVPAPADLAAARHHWVDHCALCHAVDGSGNTPIGRNLYPPAPDMRDALTQDLSDGELFYIISNGIRLTGMPAWGGLHSKEDTWQLVSFIRRLPSLTDEEVHQLQEMAEGEGSGSQGGEGQHQGPGTQPHRH